MIYTNFIFTIFAKFSILNFVNLEVFCNLPFEISIPFLIPIISYGIFPLFQLPQFVRIFL